MQLRFEMTYFVYAATFSWCAVIGPILMIALIGRAMSDGRAHGCPSERQVPAFYTISVEFFFFTGGPVLWVLCQAVRRGLFDEWGHSSGGCCCRVLNRCCYWVQMLYFVLHLLLFIVAVAAAVVFDIFTNGIFGTAPAPAGVIGSLCNLDPGRQLCGTADEESELQALLDCAWPLIVNVLKVVVVLSSLGIQEAYRGRWDAEHILDYQPYVIALITWVRLNTAVWLCFSIWLWSVTSTEPDGPAPLARIGIDMFSFVFWALLTLRKAEESVIFLVCGLHAGLIIAVVVFTVSFDSVKGAICYTTIEENDLRAVLKHYKVLLIIECMCIMGAKLTYSNELELRRTRRRPRNLRAGRYRPAREPLL